MQISARRLARVELWSAPQCAGGVRLAFIPRIVDCAASTQLPTTGIDELTLDLPITAANAGEFIAHRVVRIWEDDTRFDEWRIARVDRQPDGGIIRVSCAAIETFFAVRSAPISQVTGGVCFYNIDVVGLKPSEIIDQWVLPALTADGVTWLARGTIDQDSTIDLPLDWDTPLGTLRKIADALKLELQFRRNGTAGYYVDLLTRIGSAAATVDVRYGKNLAGAQLQHSSDEQVNRVFPRGADEEGVHATIARATWKVNTVVGAVITLIDPQGGDGPLAFDGQLVGAYLRKQDGTLTQVTASSAAAQSVTVASATGITPDQLIQFRKNAAGDDLTHLDAPVEQAVSGVVTGWPDYPEIPGTNNVIPNPAVRTWPAGDVPTGWTKIGAPTTSKNVTAPFFRTAPHSLKVIATIGQGVQSPSGRVYPTVTKPHGSGYASLWIASGEVKVELVVTTPGGDVVLPTAPAIANSTVLGQWIDLGISGEDMNALGATAVAVRITAVLAGTVFYVDRGQSTESGSQQPFFEGAGGTRLWQLGNEVLRLRGAPIPTFTITMADLARVNPTGYPHDALPELGASANVTDSRILTATAGSRISALRINYMRPGETALTISTRPEDLTGALARTPRAPRLSPVVSQPNAQAGPTLDVNAVPGSSSFTINYSVNATVFEYQVDGGGFTSVPASGFTVTRPAAGANDKVLEFRASKNDQVISNTITIPAIDKDTVTPDLTVTQTAQATATTSFQATTSNPGGGAAPSLTVEFVNCTGQGYAGAGPFTIASGTVVVVDRPAYGSNQATVKFRSVIAGGGSEEVSRTVQNKVPGPSLDVRATPGSTNFTITYTVDATTFEYSVDGAAYGAVPSSGFTVTRPSAGSNDKTLTFRAAKDGITVVDTITVPAVDKDTVTPDLSVTQTAQADATTSFQATITNPGGGSTPTLTVEFINCTASGYVGAGPHPIASGTIVVVDRPAYGANQGTVKFRSTISGGGAEEILRTIANRKPGPSMDITAVPGSSNFTINYTVDATTFEYSTDGAAYAAVPASGFTVSRPAAGSNPKTLSFRAAKDGITKVATITVPAITNVGPSLDVTAVPGTTSYTINYTVTATTFEYSIDGGAYTSVPATGFTVTRNAVGGAPKTLTFRAIKDGQTVTLEISIPPQAVGTLAMSVTALASQGGGAGPPYNQIDLSWSTTGMPSGTTYNCGYDNGGGNMDSDTSIAGTSKTFTGVTFNGSPGKGAVFVDAVHEGRVIASVKKNKTYNI